MKVFNFVRIIRLITVVMSQYGLDTHRWLCFSLLYFRFCTSVFVLYFSYTGAKLRYKKEFTEIPYSTFYMTNITRSFVNSCTV